jgi:redox-sensitive bicupin YhaK (pirin superfamily)
MRQKGVFRRVADVAIWSIALEAGARWTLPAAASGQTVRTLYFFAGASVQIGGRSFAQRSAIEVAADRPVELAAGPDKVELLLLQGRPIGEPVAQYGPIVMNTRQELEQAFADYRRTQFGGWPYPSAGPVFPRNRGRFARHADGRVEEAPS